MKTDVLHGIMHGWLWKQNKQKSSHQEGSVDRYLVSWSAFRCMRSDASLPIVDAMRMQTVCMLQGATFGQSKHFHVFDLYVELPAFAGRSDNWRERLAFIFHGTLRYTKHQTPNTSLSRTHVDAVTQYHSANPNTASTHRISCSRRAVPVHLLTWQHERN